FVTIWCSMRGWDKLRQRAVYQPYILAMQIVALVCLRWQAPINVGVVHDLRYVPFALLGAIGGLAGFQRLTTKQFQIAVSVLLGVSGVGLLVQALLACLHELIPSILLAPPPGPSPPPPPAH